MKKKLTDRLINTSIITIIIISVFLTGLYIEEIIIDIETVIISPQESTGCENLNLEETANCLRLELSKFYYYNISNVYNKLSFDELKEQGGVCSHYSEWYHNQSIRLGFNSEEVTIEIGETYLHQFSIISDETGYCKLDQKSEPACFSFGFIDFDELERVKKLR